MGAFGGGSCGKGRMKTPLPGDETSMPGGVVGGAPAHTGGTGAPEAWLPRCPKGRGRCKLRVGSPQVGGWRPGCFWQGGTWEGQPQAVGVPTSRAEGSQ